MTPKWSNLTSRDVIRKLNKNNFYQTRQKGSHAYFHHDDGRFAIVPVHKKRNLSRGVIKNIEKTAGLKFGKLTFLKNLFVRNFEEFQVII